MNVLVREVEICVVTYDHPNIYSLNISYIYPIYVLHISYIYPRYELPPFDSHFDPKVHNKFFAR